jgi:hypothetical protein
MRARQFFLNLLRSPRQEKEAEAGTYSRAYNVLYSVREIAHLKRNLGLLPLQMASGRGLCPFCLHMEARWRTQEDTAGSGRFTVRVRCSQCQRFAVYTAKRKP